MRKNKWWWSIFTWLVDVSIQNAWLLQRKSGLQNISQLQFRRNIASHYMHTLSLGIHNRAIFHTFKIPEIDRYDRMDHFPEHTTKRRCAVVGCERQSRTMCGKCNVALCIDDKGCFKTYHTLQK